MSTQSKTDPTQPLLESLAPKPSESDDSQLLVPTQEIQPIEQRPAPPSLVDAWVKALRAAEVFHLCVHPTYLRHSESELISFVHAALRSRRDPSLLVAELLAQGAEGRTERRSA